MMIQQTQQKCKSNAHHRIMQICCKKKTHQISSHMMLPTTISSTWLRYVTNDVTQRHIGLLGHGTFTPVLFPAPHQNPLESWKFPSSRSLLVGSNRRRYTYLRRPLPRNSHCACAVPRSRDMNNSSRDRAPLGRSRSSGERLDRKHLFLVKRGCSTNDVDTLSTVM